MKKEKAKRTKFIESINLGYPGFKYYLPAVEKKPKKSKKKIVINRNCQPACTKIITLLPKMKIEPRSGYGFHVQNVNGYRYINAYVISDPLNSSALRGFEMMISFSLSDFVYGQGSLGETEWFYNFDNYYNNTESPHKLIRAHTSDLNANGGLPWIGGNHLSHILRIPVMGPYIRGSAMNVGSSEMEVEILAYLVS